MGTLPTSFVPSTTQLHRLRGAGFSCVVSLTSDSCSLIRLSYKRLLSGTEKFPPWNRRVPPLEMKSSSLGTEKFLRDFLVSGYLAEK